MGYHRAGFDVIGVDIDPQPHYPFEFFQFDAMTYPLDGFDAIHASPPCQDHTCLNNGAVDHDTGWMLAATIARLCATGLPWVVENVPGPTSRGHHFTLCGSAFALGVRRHRRFWSSVGVMAPPCAHALQPRPIDVTGNGRGSKQRLIDRGRNSPPITQADRREAMGIDWMNRDELAQSIPPAYTEWIGTQLLAALKAAA